jgi:hypothetical protein
MTNTQYAKLTKLLIAAWFMFSLVASAMHVFLNNPDRPPLALGLAVLIPVSCFAIWAACSANFRRFLLSLNPRSLTIVHTWRVAGYTFLVLYTYAILPGFFALSAGWGDITIGATAYFVATRLVSFNHRKSFIFWQMLGLADLVTAITLGAAAKWISPHAIATTPMALLPLSLIPTFAVPLLIILHGISIAHARQWTADSCIQKRVTTSLILERQAI